MSGRTSNGRSSIYFSEIDGYWHGRVTMGVRDDGSPDRRHRMGSTEAEVTCKVRQLERQRDTGNTAKPGRAPTVQQWMSTYLDTIAVRNLAPRSFDDYWSKTRNWIVPHLGKHRLDRLQPEHLDKMYAKMAAAGKAGSHALKVHRILSRALETAVRRGHVARNVAKLVDAPSASETEITPLSASEARAILAVAADRPNGARWSAGFALGLRQGEALGCAGPTSTSTPGSYACTGSYSATPGDTGAPTPPSAPSAALTARIARAGAWCYASRRARPSARFRCLPSWCRS